MNDFPEVVNNLRAIVFLALDSVETMEPTEEKWASDLVTELEETCGALSFDHAVLIAKEILRREEARLGEVG